LGFNSGVDEVLVFLEVVPFQLETVKVSTGSIHKYAISKIYDPENSRKSKKNLQLLFTVE
jgi:hypothetical protein